MTAYNDKWKPEPLIQNQINEAYRRDMEYRDKMEAQRIAIIRIANALERIADILDEGSTKDRKLKIEYR